MFVPPVSSKIGGKNKLVEQERKVDEELRRLTGELESLLRMDHGGAAVVGGTLNSGGALQDHPKTSREILDKKLSELEGMVIGGEKLLLPGPVRGAESVDWREVVLDHDQVQ